LSSPITLQDFHAKALADYGIADLWPEAVLKEAKTKKEHITKEIDALETFPFVQLMVKMPKISMMQFFVNSQIMVFI
jgi:hypothetical protein